MRNQRIQDKFCRAAAVLSGSCMLLGTDCTAEQLEAVLVGLEAVASHLDRVNAADNDNDDISFGDWLLSELND